MEKVLNGLMHPKSLLGMVGSIIGMLFISLYVVFTALLDVSDKSNDSLDANTRALTELSVLIKTKIP